MVRPPGQWFSPWLPMGQMPVKSRQPQVRTANPDFSADGKSIAYYNIPPGPTAHAPADPLYLDPTSRIMLTTDSPGSSAVH